jgi:membrane-associated phospholipid phosphatase
MRQDILNDVSALGGLPLYLAFIIVFAVILEFGVVWQLLVGLALAYALISGVRSVYIRDRPKPVPYRTWWQKIDAGTAISMHAMRVTILSIILINFLSNIWATTVLILLAVFVASSRYFLKKHYFADCAWGVVLGAIVGFVVLWTI